jgi:predicted RNA-binding Zn-ribbon protein involved in translation (DUF1610 family)
MSESGASARPCPKCGAKMTWKVIDTTYDDVKIECTKCEYHYYVDGDDG